MLAGRQMRHTGPASPASIRPVRPALPGMRRSNTTRRPMMIVGGIGMGMVFVPLLDIVMASVEPAEMGSASGVLQAVNSLSMALGVAGLGAVFFGLLPATAGQAGAFVSAAQWTLLATVGLLACAFALGFGLPRHAREMTAPEAITEPALEMAGAGA